MPTQKPKMNKEMREFLHAKVRALVHERKGELTAWLGKIEPEIVKIAKRTLEEWQSAKNQAQDSFNGELEVFTNQAKEDIIFGDKTDVDNCLTRIEMLELPPVKFIFVCERLIEPDRSGHIS